MAAVGPVGLDRAIAVASIASSNAGGGMMEGRIHARLGGAARGTARPELDVLSCSTAAQVIGLAKRARIIAASEAVSDVSRIVLSFATSEGKFSFSRI